MPLLSHSVAETEQIAARFALTLPPGSVIALHGDLGAGKTQFVRGLVTSLGGNPRAVSSPTFSLLNIYSTKSLTVYHLDAYRTSSPEEMDAIGFSELLDQNGIVIIEWPTRLTSLLPPHTIHVHIDPEGPSERRITLPDRP